MQVYETHRKGQELSKKLKEGGPQPSELQKEVKVEVEEFAKKFAEFNAEIHKIFSTNRFTVKVLGDASTLVDEFNEFTESLNISRYVEQHGNSQVDRMNSAVAKIAQKIQQAYNQLSTLVPHAKEEASLSEIDSGNNLLKDKISTRILAQQFHEALTTGKTLWRSRVNGRWTYQASYQAPSGAGWERVDRGTAIKELAAAVPRFLTHQELAVGDPTARDINLVLSTLGRINLPDGATARGFWTSSGSGGVFVEQIRKGLNRDVTYSSQDRINLERHLTAALLALIDADGPEVSNLQNAISTLSRAMRSIAEENEKARTSLAIRSKRGREVNRSEIGAIRKQATSLQAFTKMLNAERALNGITPPRGFIYYLFVNEALESNELGDNAREFLLASRNDLENQLVGEIHPSLESPRAIPRPSPKLAAASPTPSPQTIRLTLPTTPPLPPPPGVSPPLSPTTSEPAIQGPLPTPPRGKEERAKLTRAPLPPLPPEAMVEETDLGSATEIFAKQVDFPQLQAATKVTAQVHTLDQRMHQALNKVAAATEYLRELISYQKTQADRDHFSELVKFQTNESLEYIADFNSAANETEQLKVIESLEKWAQDTFYNARKQAVRDQTNFAIDSLKKLREVAQSLTEMEAIQDRITNLVEVLKKLAHETPSDQDIDELSEILRENIEYAQAEYKRRSSSGAGG